jgi:acyl transferase domain-containing protein
MGWGLHRAHAGFRDAVDEVLDALGAEGARVRRDWLSPDPEVPIDHVTRAQPLLFALDVALGRVVRDWGTTPVALLGHSIGELAAAVLAGVFATADAAALLRDRVARLAAAPPGGMLAVGADRAAVAAVLDDAAVPDVVVAAVNAPWQTVLAGPVAPLAAAAAALAARGVVVRPVPAGVAFHSPALAPACAGAERAVAALPVHPARIEVRSAFTGSVLTPREAGDPAFWASHPTAPVLFWPALDGLLAAHRGPVVEAGPGQGLALLARRHPAVEEGRCTVVALLGRRPRPGEDVGAQADAELAGLERVRALVTTALDTTALDTTALDTTAVRA